MPKPVSPEQRLLIEAECNRLIAAYCYHVDRRHYDELAALFTEDGMLDRGGNITNGRENILAAMQLRPAQIATRHLNGTPHFISVTANEVTAVTYMIMYIVEGTDEGPNEVPGTAGIAEFHDTFRFTPEGWRIASRTAKSAMISKR